MSALPFAYAWRWKGGVTWKLTLTKNLNAHRDLEIKELFDHSELAATVIEQQRIITALSEDASKAAELARALEPFAMVAEHDIGDDEDDSDAFRPMQRNHRAPKITVGHMRRARAALDAKP